MNTRYILVPAMVVVLLSILIALNMYVFPRIRKEHHTRSWFSHFAKWSSDVCGKSGAFVTACFVLLFWAATGPLFKFSDTWQLAINTGTTIVTFLMVFLIQNTQNRESEMTQVKLDEIIRALEGAHNRVIDADEEDDEELKGLLSSYKQLGRKARDAAQLGIPDTDSPDIDSKADMSGHSSQKVSNN